LVFFLIFGRFFNINSKLLFPNFDVIYNIFLPIILFDSAIKIDIHQLRLQLKTLGFLTTFGLIINAVIIALLFTFFLKVPFFAGLIFGALISATDPIGVLALFEKIKVPGRLKLIIEGESMFNDATTIVFFEFLFAVFFATTYEKSQIAIFTEHLFFKFFLSSVVGILLGLLTVYLGNLFKKDIKLVDLMLNFMVLIFFSYSENWRLSGPIVVILMGLIYANFSEPFFESRESQKEKHYFSLLALLINIYFFSVIGNSLGSGQLSFNFDLKTSAIVIGIILLARSLSVYINFFITNKAKFFYDEPDVYYSWQHIINVGGLRGIIPLILVDTLPQSFVYKEQFVNYTYLIFIFTNLINASIIPLLINKYARFFYSDVIKVAQLVERIFENIKMENYFKNDLKILMLDRKNWFFSQLKKKIESLDKGIESDIEMLEKKSVEIIENSLHFISIKIESNSHRYRYTKKLLSYDSLVLLKSELDLQKDAILYPEKFANRIIDEKGFIIKKSSLRIKLYNFFKKFLDKKGSNLDTQSKILSEKARLYYARVISSIKVIEYMNIFLDFNKIKSSRIGNIFEKVIGSHLFFVNYNLNKLKKLTKENRSSLDLM
jgi:CPA1 family monovalent cation:H+ antiporter